MKNPGLPQPIRSLPHSGKAVNVDNRGYGAEKKLEGQAAVTCMPEGIPQFYIWLKCSGHYRPQKPGAQKLPAPGFCENSCNGGRLTANRPNTYRPCRPYRPYRPYRPFLPCRPFRPFRRRRASRMLSSWLFGYEGLSGQHQRCDAGCVLEGEPHYLRRVDYAGFDQIAVFFGFCIEAVRSWPSFTFSTTTEPSWPALCAI